MEKVDARCELPKSQLCIFDHPDLVDSLSRFQKLTRTSLRRSEHSEIVTWVKKPSYVNKIIFIALRSATRFSVLTGAVMPAVNEIELGRWRVSLQPDLDWLIVL